jgi:hypothetical protein
MISILGDYSFSMFMGCRSEMENEFYELIRKHAGFVDIASPNFVWKSSKPYSTTAALVAIFRKSSTKQRKFTYSVSKLHTDSQLIVCRGCDNSITLK